jgi:hypothetical protein
MLSMTNIRRRLSQPERTDHVAMVGDVARCVGRMPRDTREDGDRRVPISVRGFIVETITVSGDALTELL